MFEAKVQVLKMNTTTTTTSTASIMNTTITSTTTAIMPLPTLAPPDYTESDAPSYGPFYTVVIFLGVIGLPAVIMFRVCWVRRMNARYQRQMAERGRHRDPDNPEVFTVYVDPESYLPTYEQSVADSPPPYDQIILKKNQSSSSLPQYSVEDTTQTIDTSQPVENVSSHSSETVSPNPVENVSSRPENNNTRVSPTQRSNNT